MTAYQKGIAAFHAGAFPDDNPHPMSEGNGSDRIDWFNGFFDEKHDTMFGEMFREAGIPTMREERQLAAK